MARSTFAISRDELYRLVWAQPKSELARSIGISDVALGKWCRKLRIPIPGRGYWARRAAGVNISIPPLPQLEGLPERIVIRPQSKDEPVEIIEPQFQKDERVPDRISVAAALRKPHAVVAATRHALHENRPDQHGMLWATAYAKDCVPISVSRSQASRALRILDALMKQLVRLGATFRRDSREREFCAVIDRTEIAFSMREGYRQHRLSEAEFEEIKKKDKYFYGKFRYEPTGKLELKVESQAAHLYHTWRDGKTAIEEQLPEIVSAFLQAPREAKRHAEERRQEELERWKAQEKARAEQEAREAEIKAREELVAEGEAWRARQTVVAYLDALNGAIRETGCVVSNEGREWLAQARCRAMAIDPIADRLELLAGAQADEDAEEMP